MTTPLQQVAIGAGEGQVFRIIGTAVLPGDDVLDMKSKLRKFL